MARFDQVMIRGAIYQEDFTSETMSRDIHILTYHITQSNLPTQKSPMGHTYTRSDR